MGIMMKYTVRPIEPKDDQHMRDIILKVSQEYGAYDPSSKAGEGCGAGDPELQNLHAAYRGNGSRYWVIADESGNVVGGGGYARLKGTHESDGICEMQKVFILPEARGGGLGKQLVQLFLKEAVQDGYRLMYLESLATMKEAVSLYEHFGFEHLPKALGATGHFQAAVFMSKKLGTRYLTHP